ncbi:MAG: large conductance mechanosensitive channel protein MscL [Sphingobium sp.]|nr:large conductance mechanosensitive channel protein MscL [Sphingobium sp.]
MWKEFRAFIARGNVIDLAVAVIIGAAFGKIITSLTDDVIMPVVGRIFGGLDFSRHFIVLGEVPEKLRGSTDYAALKAAGVPLLGWGAFLTAAVNFLIIAFIIFLLVRLANATMKEVEHELGADAPKPDDAPPPEPADVVLLREIRDALVKRD